MGCCASKDKEKNIEVDLVGRKKTTDCVCCIVFFIFWILFLTIFVLGLFHGQPENIIYGIDYQGHSCGDPKLFPGSKANNCTKGSPCSAIYYPKLAEDASASAKSGQVVAFGLCLPKCPREHSVVCSYDYHDTYGLPEVDSVIPCKTDDYKKQHEELCSNCWVVPLNTTSIFHRCVFIEPSTEEQNEYCTYPVGSSNPLDPTYIDPKSSACLTKDVVTMVTKTQIQDSAMISSQLKQISGSFSSWIEDITNGYIVILIICAIALVFGIVFLSLLSTCSTVLMWIVIVLIVLVSLVLTIFCFYKANMMNLDDIVQYTSDFFNDTWNVDLGVNTTVPISDLIDTSFLPTSFGVEAWTWCAWIMLVLFIIIFVLSCALGSYVHTSSAIIKEATKSLTAMPCMLICPIMVAIGTAIILLFFVVSSVLMVSSDLTLSQAVNSMIGSIDKVADINNTAYICDDLVNKVNCTMLPDFLTGSSTLNYITVIINLFGFYWNIEFIEGICLMTIAGAVGKWYFTKLNEKGRKENVGNKTVFQAFNTVIRCHLGSVAFGSCIIAIVKVLRAILLWIEGQQKKQVTGMSFSKCFFKCCSCCLWCLEKCLKYISANAYILVITRGKNFCSACVQSFGLLLLNIGQVTLLNTFSSIFMFLGKVLSAAICGVSAYYIIDYLPSFNISGLKTITDPFPVVVICVIIGYIIAACFTSVYDMTIDTILLCYCEDKDFFKERNNRYCTKGLRQTVGEQDKEVELPKGHNNNNNQLPPQQMYAQPIPQQPQYNNYQQGGYPSQTIFPNAN
ncbi:hypothetical protein WA158_005572 [Blastocystis sp. Blastoise]